MDDFEIMERLSSFTLTEIPANLRALKNKEIRFRDISSKDEILDRIKDFIGGNKNA